MITDDTRIQIENITKGIILKGNHDHCTTIRNLLCGRFSTSTTVKEKFESNAIIKKEQAQFIEQFSKEHGLWIHELPPAGKYLTHGGEARVYYNEGDLSVIKLNEAVYYATWLEFFNSILLHNLFFENTSYHLLGMAKEDDVLLAVLKQPFITSDSQAELEDIKKFLLFNGFEHTKRQDYIHPELGLILEDMHDENVIVNSETLFFIDTVFYTVAPVKG